MARDIYIYIYHYTFKVTSSESLFVTSSGTKWPHPGISKSQFESPCIRIQAIWYPLHHDTCHMSYIERKHMHVSHIYIYIYTYHTRNRCIACFLKTKGSWPDRRNSGTASPLWASGTQGKASRSQRRGARATAGSFLLGRVQEISLNMMDLQNNLGCNGILPHHSYNGTPQ